MTYYLYADVVLLNNFAMDFLLLTAVKKLLRLETRRFGCILAALTGAVYSLVILLLPFPLAFWQVFLVSIGMSILMAALAFRLKGRKELLRAVSGLYFASVMAAGVMELFRLLGCFSAFWLYGLALFLSVWLSFRLWGMVSACALRQKNLYQVELWLGEKKQTVTALLDTGNHLTEPISGEPVSILWGGAAKELLNESEGIFCIPFHSVGREHGVLLAVRADRMEIQMEGFRQVIENPYIAVAAQPLSQSGAYQMLLHEKMW